MDFKVRTVSSNPEERAEERGKSGLETIPLPVRFRTSTETGNRSKNTPIFCPSQLANGSMMPLAQDTVEATIRWLMHLSTPFSELHRTQSTYLGRWNGPQSDFAQLSPFSMVVFRLSFPNSENESTPAATNETSAGMCTTWSTCT